MFELISYGGGGFLQAVLNGVAMFFGSANYIYALKMAATLACLGILVSSAFSGRFPDLKWMFIVILIYVVMFVPKVDVVITDVVERTPGFPASTPTVRVVGNVPMGLAFTASMTSQMKDYFTRGIETVFAMPNEISFRRGGPLFAQGIAESGLNARPKDPNLNVSLANFWKDCVFFDISLGFYSLTDLAKADDLATFLANNTASNRMYEHVAQNGTKTFEVCKTSIQAGALAVDMQAEVVEVNQAIAFVNNYANLPSGANNNALISSGAAAMPMALQYLTGISLTSSQALMQTTLANSFSNGLVAFSSSADAQTVMQGYTAAKAEAERSLSFGVLGRISGKMLPLINIIAEGLIYAVFPIIGLMLMFPGAPKVLMGYIIALAWIALWAPLYAIFHFFSMYFTSRAGISAAQICDAANACSPHLNMYTMSSMREAFANAANISGYFATMVPMVAYMLVSKSGAMMAGTVGRALDGYAQPVGHAATEAAGGNLSAGNTSFQNQQAFSQNTAPSNSSGHMVSNTTGDMTVMETSSGQIWNQNLGAGVFDGASTQSIQNAASQNLSHSLSAKDQAATSLAEARVAKFQEIDSQSHGGTHSVNSGNSTGYNSTSGESHSVGTLQTAANKWAETHLDSTQKEAFFKAMAGMTAGAGIPAPGGGVGVNASVNAGYGASAAITDSNSHVRDFLNSSEAKDALDHAKRSSIGIDAGEQRTAVSQESHGRSASDERLTKAEENYTRSVERVETAQKAVSTTSSDGFQVSEKEGLAIQERLRSEMGAERAQAAMVDVGRGVSSEDAGRAREVVAEYFAGAAPGAAVDADVAMSGVQSQGELAMKSTRDEANSEVKDDSRGFHAGVPKQGLEGAAQTAHGLSVSATTALHNGSAEQVAEQGRDTKIEHIQGSQEVAGNTAYSLSQAARDALKGKAEEDK